MNEQLGARLLLYFTIAYTVIFTSYSVYTGNWEFLLYFSFILAMIIFAALYYKKLHLPIYILAGISMAILLNFLGAYIIIGGERLYAFMIGDIIRYDNFIHFFAIFTLTFLAYNFLRPHLDLTVRRNPFFLAGVLVLMGMGIGAINEIVELTAVTSFIYTGVGSYTDNALDLVYNMLGALVASMIIVKYHRILDKD